MTLWKLGVRTRRVDGEAGRSLHRPKAGNVLVYARRITHRIERRDDHLHIVIGRTQSYHDDGTQVEFGSPGRDRTYDKSVNSRLLYR